MAKNMENHDKLLQDLELQERQKKANIKPKGSSFFRKVKRIIISLIILILVLFTFFYINGSASKEHTLSWLDKIPVIGQIKKGQDLTAADNGCAMIAPLNSSRVFAVALETSDDEGVKIIEALVL